MGDHINKIVAFFKFSFYKIQHVIQYYIKSYLKTKRLGFIIDLGIVLQNNPKRNMYCVLFITFNILH